MTNRSTITKQKLLDAATEIIMEHGVHQLTLEEVAKTAGVSKGGLLYHYPSKEALLTAIVERLQTEQNDLYESLQADGHGPVEAFVRLFDETKLYPERSPIHIDAEKMIAFLTLFAVDQAYADRWKHDLDTFFAEFQQTSDPVETMIIRYALEGMMMSEHFNVGVPPTALKQDIIARLIERARHIDSGN
ncbi:TetR/AcrR family transcriptional regulator [Exiguobacterium sp. SH0S2]|uniref:TetR/AcrR family transcriptional regulator n=1 Tax=Exiguobacterium sp. SH0S2 TaxID=2510950 RepID=UPI00103E4482|nr:TetR/AcrR family transcriptional regulator [Exiguobacterium sp. SH0S2]TCI60590.1 TetR/AcrR family transcriptional regulator [Exiguobacterium sp. SH0S2]